MTYEAKALPDWKPEDCRLPDEWIIAWLKGRLTYEQGNLMCNHCSGCTECEGRLSYFAYPDWWNSRLRVDAAFSGEGEPLAP